MKWIPQVPDCKWASWKNRRDEIQGFWSWAESLSSWLGLLQPAYPPEIKEVLSRDDELKGEMLSPQQNSRSSRVFYLLKQAFSGNKRVEAMVRIYELQQGVGSTNGYELFRLLRREFSIKSRTEAIQFRQEFLEMKSQKSDSPVEILRTIEARYLQFRLLIFTCPYPQMTNDVDIPESDLYVLILKSMPATVEQYLRFHCGETVADLRRGIEFIQSRQIMTGDLSRVSTMRLEGNGKGDWFGKKGKGKDEKGKGKGKDSVSKGKGKGEKGKERQKGKDGGKREPSRDGKGKGKDSKNRSSTPQRNQVDKEKAKKEGLCYKCGKPGHQAKDCWKGGGNHVRSAEDDKEESTGNDGGSEPECEIFAVFRRFAVSGSETKPDGATMNQKNVSGNQDLREASLGKAEVVASTAFESSSQGCDSFVSQNFAKSDHHDGSRWLIDSGATSHIVSSNFLNMYKVVKEYDHHKIELRAANNELIPVKGLVDIGVHFPLPNGKKQRVTLTKVLVCDIGMNVLSTYVLSINGWKTALNMSDSSLSREGLVCPLLLDDRAWWLCAKDVKKSVSRKPRRDDMDVDKVQDGNRKVQEIQASSRDLEGSGPWKPAGILKRNQTSRVETYCHEPSGLTFLLRTMSSHDTSLLDLSETQIVEASENSTCDLNNSSDEFHDCVEWFDMSADDQSFPEELPDLEEIPEVALPFDVPDPIVPPSVRDFILESEFEQAKEWEVRMNSEGHHVLVERDEGHEIERPNGVAEDLEVDIPLEFADLYSHLSQGHVPYLAACESCTRARGRIPAKRLKHTKGPYEIACDFTFLGPLRIFVAVVLCTSMVGTVVWGESDETNARGINACFKELGLVGKSVEATIDGENLLEASLKKTMRLENATLGGLSVELTPPNRSQANGKCERFCGMVKHVSASNLLFLETQVGKRIALESPIVPHVVKYSARMLNLFNKVSNSVSTPLEKMKNRTGLNKHRTFPFGCTVLAKPTETAKDNPLEYLCHVSYLGPFSLTGGGFLGVFAGPSRVGVEEPDKVRRFQAARLETPVQWDLEHLIIEGGDIRKDDKRVTPYKGLSGEYDDGDEKDDDMNQEGKEEEDQTPVSIPVTNVPRSWIDVHGLTPGCYACDGILTKGTAKGRHHNQACKNRYRKWLEEEAERQKKRRRTEESSEPAAPVALPPPAVSQNVAPQHPGELGDVIPEGMDDAPIPVGSVPGSVGDASGPAVPPAPVDASASDPMELGFMEDFDFRPVPYQNCMSIDELIVMTMEEHDERFMSMEQSTLGGKWFKSSVCGMTVFQQMPVNPKCENSGQNIPLVGYQEACVKEFEQLTKLKVGTPYEEPELSRLGDHFGVKPIQTRWVIVKKTDGRIRSRLVCKDFKFRGGTALQEGIYSPTSSLESLRIVLSVSEEQKNVLCSLDVSTAFLYASLGSDEHVFVLFPSSIRSFKGNRVGMKLHKALYDLRRAPLRWYKELVRTLHKMSFESTSDSTLFRRIDRRGILSWILIYVDDCLLSCPSVQEKDAILQELSKHFELKQTGCIENKTSQLEFLGRIIRREYQDSPLLLGLPTSYYDDIENALGCQLSPQPNPPDITRFAVVKEEEKLLGTQDASLYRTVLGKLAWYSLTFPTLSFYVSFLSITNRLLRNNRLPPSNWFFVGRSSIAVACCPCKLVS